MARRIRAFDWASTPLGPLATWPQPLRTAVDMMLTVQLPITVYWGRDAVRLYNDAASLLEEKHPRALGSRAQDLYPEAWANTYAPLFASIFAGQGSVIARAQPDCAEREHPYSETWFDYSLSPIPLEDGSVGGVFVMGIEVTAQRRTQAALVAVAARDAFRVRLSDALRELVDPTEIRATARRLLSEHLGVEDLTDTDLERARLAGSEARAIGWAVPARSPMQPWAQPEAELIAEVAERVWSACERVRAEAVMRESEGRLRVLIEAASQAVWEADAHGAMVADSPSWRVYTGQSESEWLGEGWLNAIHPDDRVATEALWRAATAAGNNVNAECRLRRPGGGFRWTNVLAGPLRGPDGSISKWVGMNRDITARKHAEQALRDNDARRSFLLELSDHMRALAEPREIMQVAARWLGRHLDLATVQYALVEPDQDTIVSAVVYSDGRLPTVQEGQRYKLSEIGGWGAALSAGQDVFSDDNRQDPRALYDSSSRAHGLRSGSAVPLVKEGRLVAILASAHSDLRHWTETEKWLQRDVAERTWAATERARVEAALRESEERFRALVSATADVIYRMSADWSEVRAVSGGGFVAGRSTANARWIEEYVPAEERPRLIATIERAVKSKGVFELEHRVVRGDGSMGWTFSRAVPLLDADGEIKEWFGAATDVTFSKQTEDALRKSEQHLAKALSTDTIGVLFFNLDGRMLDANRAFERMSGYTSGELRSAVHWDMLTAPEFHPVMLHAAREIAEMGETPPYEKQFIRKDGSRFWGLCAPTRLDGSGPGAACFAFILDISEQKRLQEQREDLLAAATAAHREAERANQAKDEFLATLSHELRTPLAAILLWAGAIRSGAVPVTDLGRATEAIMQGARNQSRLIEDLLDLSRLTSGKLLLAPTRASVENVARAAVDVVRPMAQARQVTLEVELAEGLGTALLDAARLQQVLWNLLSNAIKFTPERGRVTLRVRRQGEALELEVADTGVGIAAGFMPHVFERFRQGDMGETRQHAGLGIGLALSRHLVELQQGTIEAHSDGPGLGASFRVRLPWVEAAPAGAGLGADVLARPGPSLSGVTVLLVEDDANTREAMYYTLASAGANVVAVSSGDEALELLMGTEYPNGSPAPSIIVSDLGLPGMSGYELMERIARTYRARGQRPIPACAVSAHARDVDRQRAMAAGFDLYLTKPVMPDRLIEAALDLQDVARTLATDDT